MQLDEALRQISDIRQQMARSEVFRGYRSATVGFSGVVGVLVAVFQPLWVASPESELGRYLGLWLCVAAVSLVVAGGEMWWRARSTGSELARQRTLLAVQQFLPCVVVGALLTVSIYRGAPHVAWMLPGLWSLVYGLWSWRVCLLSAPATTSVLGRVVLRSVWLRLSALGARCQRVFALADGYLFWRRPTPGRRDSILDAGAH